MCGRDNFDMSGTIDFGTDRNNRGQTQRNSGEVAAGLALRTAARGGSSINFRSEKFQDKTSGKDFKESLTLFSWDHNSYVICHIQTANMKSTMRNYICSEFNP